MTEPRKWDRVKFWIGFAIPLVLGIGVLAYFDAQVTATVIPEIPFWGHMVISIVSSAFLVYLIGAFLSWWTFFGIPVSFRP